MAKILMDGNRAIAEAAMREGRNVTYLPAYGAEVRGGTANCTVAISDDEIATPVASSPEFIIAMNQPSALKAVLKPLKEENINVHYFYTSLGRGESGQPIVIIGVDKTQQAVEALEKNRLHLFRDEIYSL